MLRSGLGSRTALGTSIVDKPHESVAVECGTYAVCGKTLENATDMAVPVNTVALSIWFRLTYA